MKARVAAVKPLHVVVLAYNSCTLLLLSTRLMGGDLGLEYGKGQRKCKICLFPALMLKVFAAAATDNA